MYDQQILKILLFFAIFRSLSCQQSTQDGTVKIGERCEKDRNCIPHAFCRSQIRSDTCLCDQYYSPVPDNSMCIASAGLSCTNDLVCSSMTNAMCRQGVCACKDSYILDINNSSNCVGRPLVVGDRCQRTDECQDVFDRAMCINGRCRCITSYHFVNETGKCVQTRFLYNSCTNSYECRSLHNETVLECRNGECVNTGGQGTYAKGSTLALLGILVTLLCFVH